MPWLRLRDVILARASTKRHRFEAATLRAPPSPSPLAIIVGSVGLCRITPTEFAVVRVYAGISFVDLRAARMGAAMPFGSIFVAIVAIVALRRLASLDCVSQAIASTAT